MQNSLFYDCFFSLKYPISHINNYSSPYILSIFVNTQFLCVKNIFRFQMNIINPLLHVTLHTGYTQSI